MIYILKKYLEGSPKIKLLGDIELNDEEINHLKELISKELKNPKQLKTNSFKGTSGNEWEKEIYIKENNNRFYTEDVEIEIQPKDFYKFL